MKATPIKGCPGVYRVFFGNRPPVVMLHCSNATEALMRYLERAGLIEEIVY